jgi:hypothetical protein
MNLRCFALGALTLLAFGASARASDSTWAADDEPEKLAAAAPPVEAASKTRGSTVDVQLDAGFAYHHIFDIPIYGADFSAGIGRKTAESAWRITLGGFVGETDVGYHLDEIHFGATLEARPLRWLRLGADMHMLYITESPPSGATPSGPSGWALGPGVRPYVAFDFAPEAPASPSLTFGFEATLLGGSESGYALWGPSVSLGVHF